MTTEVNERDIVATEEMIRNLRAGTLQKVCYGIGAVSAALLVGASLLVWTWKHGNDPETLKEALRHMPPLTVNVKLDPDSRTVKLEQPAMVQLEPRSILSGIPGTGGNGGGGDSNDPAIQTSVTMFKTVAHGSGSVVTGWRFANGASKTPESQSATTPTRMPVASRSSRTSVKMAPWWPASPAVPISGNARQVPVV